MAVISKKLQRKPPQKIKPFGKFTAKDFWEYWVVEWRRVHEQEYSGIYRGKEYSILKGILEEIQDPYILLLSIEKAVEVGMSISTFELAHLDFVEDVPDAEIYYFVRHQGKISEKEAWGYIMDIEGRWFPRASEKQKQQELLGKLKIWVDSIRGKR